MSWKDHLKRIKSEWDRMASQPAAKGSQSQSPLQTAATAEHAYWQPRFQIDVPVSAEWEAKIGNGPDGWGNQELEHYTAAPENAFQ